MIIIFLLLLNIATAEINPNTNACVEALSDHGLKQIATAQNTMLTFKDVEVFRRNNGIGLQQVGEIQFEKWIEVGSEEEFNNGIHSYIGLTKEAKVYHLIQWKNRKIARLLSGVKSIKDIYLSNKETLIAVDQNDHMLMYLHSLWLRSPAASAKALWLKTTLIGSAAAVTALSLLFPELMNMGYDTGLFTVPIPPVFLSTSIALQSFFMALIHYEYLNNNPDGFTDAYFELYDEKQMKTDWSAPPPSSLPPPMPDMATESIR